MVYEKDLAPFVDEDEGEGEAAAEEETTEEKTDDEEGDDSVE